MDNVAFLATAPHDLGSRPANTGGDPTNAGVDGGSGSGILLFSFSDHAISRFATEGSLFPDMFSSRSMPSNAGLLRRCTVRKRSSQAEPVNKNAGSVPPTMLNCLPPLRSRSLQFQSFDDAYLERLRAGDRPTEEHFGAYFSALIQIKLRSRLYSAEAIEDVRQETFARFFAALREERIRQPERLGAFVNSMCNRVLFEHYRSTSRHNSFDEEEQENLVAPGTDLLMALSAKQTKEKVREILEKLPERDRRLLREVFLEERDKDEVCREFGVDREYLRVLLHRAKQAFKALYLKTMKDEPPHFAAV